MRHGLKRLLLGLGLAFVCATPFAVFDPVNDDTDLFRNNPFIPSERPNVLIILDNTANWSSGNKFEAEKIALYQLLNGDGTPGNTGLDSSFNVGMMIMGQGGNCRTANVDGGYLRFGIRQLTTTNKAMLSQIIGTVTPATGFVDSSCDSSLSGDQGSSATGGQAMHEAYLYFGGKTSRSGITQVKRDYYAPSSTATNPARALPNNLTTPPLDFAPLSSATATVYNSPITDGCQKNYIIFISNGPMDNGDDNPSSQLFAGTGGLQPGASPIALSPSGSQSNWSDEYAKYLAETGVERIIGGVSFQPKIYTYTLEVDPVSGGQGPGHTALMKSMAQQGKGKYFGIVAAGASAAILSALKSIFSEIQAVNSVFAASTLPVSVNVRGTNLNQLYIGVFRPDAGDYPRWLGNLKAYQLKRDSATGNVFTVDAASPTQQPAINSTTGFITSSAKSFWTDGTSPSASYWSFRPASLNGDGGNSDLPDGDLVEKGGAAQKVRALYNGGVNGSPTRPVYTCTPAASHPACVANSLLSATPFTTANTAIDQNELNITSRSVTALTAAQNKTVTALVDRRAVILDNLDPLAIKNVTSIVNNNAGTPISISTLSNSRVVNITAMDNGATQKSVALTKVSNSIAKGTVTGGHGLQNNDKVSISVSGSTGAAFNVSNAQITYVDANVFTYTPGNGNLNDATGTMTKANTFVTVTAPSHGFTGGTVDITGASPTATFSGTGKAITVVDANTFKYDVAVDVAPTLSSATATGASTTVTATTSAALPTGFAVGTSGQVITISGVTGATGYNATWTITSIPTTTSFTFSTSPTAITGTVGGTKVANYGGSIATVNSTAHGFDGSVPITISGATPAGFNGTFTITNITTNSFQIDVSPGLGSPSGTIKASSGTGPTVTATLVNHGFVAGDTITIDGASATSHNADWTVLAAGLTANTFTYTTVSSLAAPGGAPHARKTSNPIAYATITGHGYGSAPSTFTVTISGAGQAAYNVSGATATIVDADTISYPLTTVTNAAGAPGTATGTVIASTASTTALATSTSHGFNSGEVVTIAGATVAAFNGAKTITKLSNDTFSYTLSSAQVAAVASATPPGITAAGQDERNNLINWVRGQDNFEDENANGSFTDTRWSVHGDVLHSRPAVVNYNRLVGCSDADCTLNVDNDVYIFYGGNDGLFRAVKGGFKATTAAAAISAAPGSNAAPGTEVWAFVARESFANLRRLRINNPPISSVLKKPFFFDGPIGVYSKDANGDGKILVTGTPDPTSATQDQVWLFLTMRRGGRFMYALDVSNPLEPRLLWKKSSTDAGMGELGYTFSEPKVTFLDSTITTDPVLIFGAGYDPLVEDQVPTTINCSVAGTSGYVRTGGTMGNCSSGTLVSRSMGRGIFVLNARTGALIFAASGQDRPAAIPSTDYLQVTDMDYSISSDIAIVVGDPTPRPFRAYFGDNGGQLWRFDFGASSKAAWKMTKIGSIGDHTTTTTFADAFSAATITALRGTRKFQFAVDVVGGSGYDVVVAGSGDREHPFDTSVLNRVYAFKDTSQTSTPPVTWAPITHSLATVTYNGISGILPLQDVSSQCIEIPANCAVSKGAEQFTGGTVSKTASANTSGALAASTNRGWFLTLGAGEKQIGSTLAAGSGSILFATNQPSTSAGGGSCAPNLGIARQYAVNYLDGTAFNGTTLATTYAGGGFLPSPVLVFVGLGGTTGTGSTTAAGVPVGGVSGSGTIGIGAGASTGGSGNTATAVVCYGASCSLAPGTVLFSRVRKFWYKEID